jgi:hypothetical protein
MTDVNQSGNSVNGGMAARDVNNSITMLPQKLSAISELNERYLVETREEQNFNQIVKELNHFCVSLPYAKKDLETKLKEGGRSSEIEEAIFLKELIAKKIVEFSKSPSAQKILSFILGKLKQSYLHKIYPQIQSNVIQSEINKSIYDEVMIPAFDFLESNPLGFNDEDLKAMIYFLAGNCHINWK